MSTRLLTPRSLAATVLSGLLLLGMAACATATATPAHRYPRAEDVVRHQFQIFNAGMASGDFSAFAQVFAPNATLTTSNTTGTTTVRQGLPAIIAYYKALQARLPQCQWTTDSVRSLSDSVVLTYDHACSPPWSVPGHCMHVFVVHAGLIVSYDWTTFANGQQ